ncbi:MAG: metallophosphoesterase [Clostridia bacterium]|nr:metallophosphoesterase [Clostridia bacterium]
MKKAKVIISLLLVALLVCTAIACIGCNKKNDKKKDYVIGIISDPQIVAASDVGDDDYYSFQDFNAVGQKMLFISEAILKTAVDRLIEQKVNVVLIPGDLTENGSKTGHLMVASQCARLEAAGIPVYVVCGNHDINKSPKKYMTVEQANAQGLTIYETFSDGSCSVRVPGVSPAEFMDIYHDFGYDNPVALDELDQPLRVKVTKFGETAEYEYDEVGTMSYVQDLPGSNYRLISVDAANYYEDENENTYYMTKYSSRDEMAIKGTGYSVMTDRLLEWIRNQLVAANDAGKKPLVMAHFPINNQMGDVVGMLTDGVDNRMNMAEDLLSLFAEHGVEYVFTGHLHTQHTSTYDFFKATLTDVETGCLINYPLPIRYITFAPNGECSIANEYLNSVKAEYLPTYLNNETVKNSVLTDLQNYALDPFIYDNLLRNFDERINDVGNDLKLFYKIFDMLELDPDGTKQAELDDLASYLYNDLYKAFMTMPIYETAGKNSIEKICKKYDITLPVSARYQGKGVFQFFIQVLGKFYKYDYANDGGPITYDSTEGQILRYGICSIFDVIAESELFTKLHAINPDITESAISQNFLNKLFKEGVIDLLCDNIVFNLSSVLNPLVGKYNINLSELSPSSLVGVVDSFGLSVAFGILSEKFPGLYTKGQDKNSRGSILGVPVDSFLTIVPSKSGSTPVLTINLFVLLRDVVFDKVGNGILY